MKLFEILVPCAKNDKKPIRTRQHREWDRRVKRIIGADGLTITPPVKGQWRSESGELFHERMIPVRVVASFTQMEQIADMTAEFYEQEAVMFYEISRNVQIKHYPENCNDNQVSTVSGADN